MSAPFGQRSQGVVPDFPERDHDWTCSAFARVPTLMKCVKVPNLGLLFERTQQACSLTADCYWNILLASPSMSPELRRRWLACSAGAKELARGARHLVSRAKN